MKKFFVGMGIFVFNILSFLLVFYLNWLNAQNVMFWFVFWFVLTFISWDLITYDLLED